MINYKSRTYGKTKEIPITELKALFEHQKFAYKDSINKSFIALREKDDDISRLLG